MDGLGEFTRRTVVAVFLFLVRFLFRTIPSDVSLFLAIGTRFVFIWIIRRLLFSVFDVSILLLVGFAFAAIFLLVSRFLAIMAYDIFIRIFTTFAISFPAFLMLLFAILFGLLELRLHLFISFAVLKAMSVGLMDGTAPLFTAGFAIGATLGELLEAGAAVGVELRVLLIALLQEHVALFPIREGSIAGKVMLVD